VEFLGETFDNECLAALSPVFLTWYGMQLDPAIFVEEGKTYLFLHELILQQLILKKYVYTSLIQYPSLLSPKGERFSYGTVRTNQIFNLLDEYGPSPVRLSLLIQQSLDVNVINRYDAFLRQIRNGVRYLVLSVSDHRTTSDEAWEKFNNNADHLDIWLMTEFYEMWHAYKKVTDYQLLIDNFPMIQEFIQKKLLGWYLEAKKSDESGERNMTCFIVFSGILTLLYPFVPGYVRAMLQTLEFPYQEFIARPFEKESSFQAKWVYELFDMLYTFRLKLGIKKHQKIAIFFKADPNSLQLFEEYQQLLQKIVNIEQVILLRLHEADPTGYQQETYNGITIGIKVLHQSPSIRKPILADLEQQYAQQLEYFEYLRTVIANMSAYTFMDIETDQIRQKKAEMEKVKLHLEHLQLAIQKLKVR
jgi:valyl-tRNA synthetase